ncbi:MAG: hypothetical protein ACP5OR_07585 [Candidatus Dormibacteria bacterium]
MSKIAEQARSRISLLFPEHESSGLPRYSEIAEAQFYLEHLEPADQYDAIAIADAVETLLYLKQRIEKRA